MSQCTFSNTYGKVSKIEAAAVVKIDLERRDVRKLTGIGYFSNLEILNCNGLSKLISVDLSNNSKITSIGDRAFYNCSSLTDIVIPESVTSIGDGAFNNCSSLVEINLPEGITWIRDQAFYNCSSLTNIVIPESVTSIGDRAFYNCSSLTDIVIPESVTSIGDRAFNNCSSLVEINLPEGITWIRDQAFYNCSSLTSIYCKPTTPPKMYGGLGVSGFVLYVPAQSIEAYKNSNWSRYYSSIEAIK